MNKDAQRGLAATEIQESTRHVLRHGVLSHPQQYY
jgi:hypothetical protein